VAVAAVSLLIKLVNAWAHFGFFSGDDVEVHEMTFKHLFHLDLPVWQLRSAFYPMAFIYPVQSALRHLGVDDTAALVFAGRAVVAIMSTLTVVAVFFVAQRQYGMRTAIVATCFIAFSGLQVAFGSTELPRPVSTLFVVLAFAGVSRGGVGPSVMAGVALGIAAALRFSEAIFVVPAMLTFVLERRWRDLAVVGITGGVIGIGIQGISDWWYWGHPFFSLQNIVTFTLTDKLSSRGYQPAWYYLVHLGSWTDPVLIALASCGSAATGRRLALWAWIPLGILNCLPHKEPRYLLPVVPFIGMLAAVGLWRVVDWLIERSDTSRSTSGRLTLLAGLVSASLVFQVSSFGSFDRKWIFALPNGSSGRATFTVWRRSNCGAWAGGSIFAAFR
jgi:4-amino-4-deoxy-L-arabinose transferase-like glycosyltransferase